MSDDNVFPHFENLAKGEHFTNFSRNPNLVVYHWKPLFKRKVKKLRKRFLKHLAEMATDQR